MVARDDIHIASIDIEKKLLIIKGTSERSPDWYIRIFPRSFLDPGSVRHFEEVQTQALGVVQDNGVV